MYTFVTMKLKILILFFVALVAYQQHNVVYFSDFGAIPDDNNQGITDSDLVIAEVMEERYILTPPPSPSPRINVMSLK